MLKPINGIWAYQTTLADFLTSIQDINLSLVREKVDRSTIDHQVDTIFSADPLGNVRYHNT